MSRDTSPKRQMVANAIARFAVAFALIFEHSKILADPSTYDWMVEYEAMPVFYGAGPVGRLASRAARAQRGLVRCVGVRAWCVIICCLGAALALGRRRCRRRACAVVVAMFSGPLMVIKEVIDTKSTKNLPFPMAIATVVNCSLWLGFGLLVIDDPFVWFPHVLGLGSGIAQLALFAKYGFHTEADKKDEAE